MSSVLAHISADPARICAPTTAPKTSPGLPRSRASTRSRASHTHGIQDAPDIWCQRLASESRGPLISQASEAVRAAADALYADLARSGIDVLLDDRNERPGVAFAEMELIGIPHRVVVGERGLAEGKLEYKGRVDRELQMVPTAEIVQFLKARLCAA